MVGYHAALDPLDGDLVARINAGCARQRIASLPHLAVDRHAQRQELAGFVLERVRQRGWNVEDQRNRTVCFLHDFRDWNLEIFMTMHGRTHPNWRRRQGRSHAPALSRIKIKNRTA